MLSSCVFPGNIFNYKMTSHTSKLICMIYNIIDVPIHYPGKIPNLQADWRFLVLENCTCSSCHGSRNLPFYLHHQFSIGFWTLYKVLVWKLIPFFCVYHWRNLRNLEYFEVWQVIKIKKLIANSYKTYLDIR